MEGYTTTCPNTEILPYRNLFSGLVPVLRCTGFETEQLLHIS